MAVHTVSGDALNYKDNKKWIKTPLYATVFAWCANQEYKDNVNRNWMPTLQHGLKGKCTQKSEGRKQKENKLKQRKQQLVTVNMREWCPEHRRWITSTVALDFLATDREVSGRHSSLADSGHGVCSFMIFLYCNTMHRNRTGLQCAMNLGTQNRRRTKGRGSVL
jgi:hypothetical protein